jgi:hypothetical protein
LHSVLRGSPELSSKGPSPSSYPSAARRTRGVSNVRVTLEQRADFERDDSYVRVPHPPALRWLLTERRGGCTQEGASTRDRYGKLPEADLLGRFRTGIGQTVGGYCVRHLVTRGGPQRADRFRHPLQWHRRVSGRQRGELRARPGQVHQDPPSGCRVRRGGCLPRRFGDLPSGRPRDGSRRHLIRTQRRVHGAVCVKRVDLPVV